MNYYNEHDPNAAEWLMELVESEDLPFGYVDSRDVQEVTVDDIKKFKQCHFFAGIGGWPLALRLAGWPETEPVWSASLPCQPFSSAGNRRGIEDDRHLWPHFRELVEACRPPVIFGEQVSSKAALGDSTYVTAKKSFKSLLASARRSLAEEPAWSWFATLQADLEDLGYVVGASDLPAASVGAPHIRQRLYWCAIRRQGELPGAGSGGVPEVVEERFGGGEMAYPKTGRRGQVDTVARGCGEGSGAQGCERPEHCCGAGGMADDDDKRLERFSGNGEDRREPGRDDADKDGSDRATSGGLGISNSAGPFEGRETPEAMGHGGAVESAGGDGRWGDIAYLPCADGKARPIKRGIEPLVDGLPEGLVRGGDQSMAPDADNSAEARVMRLRGYGNAIVPELAAVFIRSVLDTGMVRNAVDE